MMAATTLVLVQQVIVVVPLVADPSLLDVTEAVAITPLARMTVVTVTGTTTVVTEATVPAARRTG